MKLYTDPTSFFIKKSFRILQQYHSYVTHTDTGEKLRTNTD